MYSAYVKRFYTLVVKFVPGKHFQGNKGSYIFACARRAIRIAAKTDCLADFDGRNNFGDFADLDYNTSDYPLLKYKSNNRKSAKGIEK